MFPRILIFFVCLLCAVPFLLLSYLGKISRTPLHFRNGDEARLAAILKDIPAYNRAMAKAYRNFGLLFLTLAVLAAALPALGILGIAIQCTLGFFLLWKKHKALVNQFSEQ